MTKKTEKSQGELIFGVHPILELLKAKRRKLISIYTTKRHPDSWEKIVKLLPRHLNIQYVDRDVLHKIAGTTDHQGIIAWAMPFIARSSFFDSRKHRFILMLDGIQDPHNLGAILRSAYCTGVDGVIITRKNSSPLNATAIKASAGLAERLEIFFVNSASQAVPLLKAAGYNIYLATISGENALDVSCKHPLCLVIGNEAVGISREILSSGVQITLPQKTEDVSYNASVAAGILLFLLGVARK